MVNNIKCSSGQHRTATFGSQVTLSKRAAIEWAKWKAKHWESRDDWKVKKVGTVSRKHFSNCMAQFPKHTDHRTIPHAAFLGSGVPE